MKKPVAILTLIGCAAAIVWGFQMRHSQHWEREMQGPVEDTARKSEFTFVRLRYRQYGSGGRFGRGYGRRGSWASIPTVPTASSRNLPTG